MQLNLVSMPQTLDMLHAILGLLALISTVWALSKKSAQPTHVATVSAPPPAPSLKSTGPDSALQLLSLFQQEARLIDFLCEEIKGFSDVEVGAAARVVHEGGKKILKDYFSLQPVRAEVEESRITVEAGFDPSILRLTGNVVGQPPFKGTLVHRGWQVTETKLPKISEGRNLQILAAAEVEL